MIRLNCREHLPCALATIDEVTRLRDENAELRRRLGEVGA